MQSTVAKFIQKSTESSGSEISSQQIWGIFEDEFINRNTPLELEKVHTELFEDGQVKSDLLIKYNGSSHSLTAVGNGPIDASKKALESIIANMSIESYSEHSLSQGSDSKAICYLTVLYEDETFHGVGIDSNITLASIKALVSSINRKLKLIMIRLILFFILLSLNLSYSADYSVTNLSKSFYLHINKENTSIKKRCCTE